MKHVITLSLALLLPFLSRNTLANETGLELPIPGVYEFNQHYALDLLKHHEIINIATEAGRHSFIQLKNEGFTCEDKHRQLFLCWKFMPTKGTTLNEEVKKQVLKAFAERTIEFFALRSDPALTNKSEIFTEYLVPQAMNIGTKHYEFYRYQILREKRKISVGVPAEDGLMIEENGEYRQVLTFTKNLSRTSYDIYQVSGYYKIN